MEDNQYPVYVGVWTNWSRGKVMGSTLTLRRRDADLLIAFTAFFIAFVTTRAWKVICFVFHRFYSTADRQDALYHQRQIIFRNSSSPESGIQMLLKLLWANRHSKGWFRPLPASIVAILCVSAFTIAGGFSSQISTAVGTEVLIKTSNCGYSPAETALGGPSYFLGLSDQATKTNNAANYAQQCYSSESTGLLDCDRFITKQVAKKIDKVAGCPFDSHLCRNQSTNLLIDSGYIDSHEVLGLNSPSANRILFRNVLHCAPLTTTGFAKEKNTSLGIWTVYQYGSMADATNYVFAARPLESQYSIVKAHDVVATDINYALHSLISSVKDEATVPSLSDFDPIDELARKDADLYLFFLSGNGVGFMQPSDDEWYHVNKTADSLLLIVGDVSKGVPVYYPEEPASPLGCTDQYQFCNTAFQGTGGCGPLASLRDATAGAAVFFNTTYAELSTDSSRGETATRFSYFMDTFFASPTSRLSQLLGRLGSTALTSQNTLFSGIQGPIASNQWQQDVSHWWDISMAIKQSQFLDVAYLADNSDLRSSRFNYTTPEFQKMCKNQKIRSTAYGSFSLFGLLFTLTAGLLITLTSYLLEPIFEFLHTRKGCNQYAYLEWATNATLQMQRIAHEEIGFGTWSQGTETIPMTKEGELLGSLDITDPRHPVLCRAMDGNGVPLSIEGFAEIFNTGIDNGSENPEMTLESLNQPSDADEEIDHNSYHNLASDEISVETQGSITNLGMIAPSGPQSNPEQPEHLPIIQVAKRGATANY